MEEKGVPLLYHIEQRLDGLEKSTEIAARAMEKRLDGMNEFRAALKDQAAMMATRQELDDHVRTIERDLRELREFRAQLQGKADQQAVNIAMALSIVGIIIGVVLKFI